MKPSNYENAVKEAENITENLGQKVPKEIDPKESKMHHVLMVRHVHEPLIRNYRTETMITKVHPGRGFDNLQKNYSGHSYQHMILVHDGLSKPAKKEFESDNEETKNSYPTITKTNVVQFAEDNAIDLTTSKTVAQKIATVNEWIKGQKTKDADKD